MVYMLVKIKQLLLGFAFLKGKPDHGIIPAKLNLTSRKARRRRKRRFLPPDSVFSQRTLSAHSPQTLVLVKAAALLGSHLKEELDDVAVINLLSVELDSALLHGGMMAKTSP